MCFIVLNTHARSIVSCGSMRHSARTYSPGKERYTKLDSRKYSIAAGPINPCSTWLQFSAISHLFTLFCHPGPTARTIEPSQASCLDRFLEAKVSVSMFTSGYFAHVVFSMLLKTHTALRVCSCDTVRAGRPLILQSMKVCNPRLD